MNLFHTNRRERDQCQRNELASRSEMQAAFQSEGEHYPWLLPRRYSIFLTRRWSAASNTGRRQHAGTNESDTRSGCGRIAFRFSDLIRWLLWYMKCRHSEQTVCARCSSHVESPGQPDERCEGVHDD